MDQPLSVWYCDVCGGKIENPNDGYVIWKSDEKTMKGRAFKIIHQSICNQRDYHNSSPLGDFLGDQGLAILLSHLSLGPIARNRKMKSSCDIEDLDEFVDFIRRVQTPYYEEARRRFSNHDFLMNFADANEVAPYFPEALKNTVQTYGENE